MLLIGIQVNKAPLVPAYVSLDQYIKNKRTRLSSWFDTMVSFSKAQQYWEFLVLVLLKLKYETAASQNVLLSILSHSSWQKGKKKAEKLL